jgi:integrase
MAENITIREAIKGYREEMASRGNAERSIYLYANALGRLATSAETSWTHDPTVRAITSECMTKYLAAADGQSARNTSLSAARGFLRWCARRHYITHAAAEDALGERKLRKVNRKPKHYIDVEQFGEALDLAEEVHAHERAVLALALYTLCRASELCFMRFKHVNLKTGELKVWRQKRKRWTTTIISPDLREELDWWLSWYAESQGSGSPVEMMQAHPDWYLLPRRVKTSSRGPNGQYGGGPSKVRPELRAYALERVVKGVLDGLGFDSDHGFVRRHLYEGMHTIRRSGARALLDHLEGEMGADRALLQVSAMLDHDDPRQTLTYIGREIEKDRLDKFLRSNRMYGGSGRRRQSSGAKVSTLPLRSAESHGDGRTASDTVGGLAETAESV